MYHIHLRHLFVVLVGVPLLCAVHGHAQRPNIVFIVADDLGWNDVGFNGGDVRTPNLDALAAHSIIFTNHYSLPACSPSRTALMTARYPIRSGMQAKPLPAGVPLSLPLTEKIFPQYFKDLGYKTHLVGKWHLGYQTKEHLPTKRGFDTFYGFLNGFISYYDATHTQSNISGRDLRKNEEGVALEGYGKYLTDLLAQEAVSVIKDHPDYGGLLMFLMHAAPHTGNLAFFREAPPSVAGNATGREVFKEMVRRLDDSVGKVVTALNDNGILNNTIIVFFSDNGAPTEDLLYGYSNFGSNWPLRGLKLSNREGGVRTPSFIWSPMLKDTARVSQQLFHISDWLPTLYSAAGGNTLDLTSSVTMDGVDQWASLTTSATPPRKEMLVDINDVYQSESYILGSWKLVKDFTPDKEVAFTLDYYGESGREAPYDEEEVAQSSVGILLPVPKILYSTVRKNTDLGQGCLDPKAALQEDCYTKYCLYNLLDDPSECRDQASGYPGVVVDISSRLESYRKVLVPRLSASIDPRADPSNFFDYWSPWMESSAVSLVPSFLVLLPLCALLNIMSWIS